MPVSPKPKVQKAYSNYNTTSAFLRHDLHCATVNTLILYLYLCVCLRFCCLALNCLQHICSSSRYRTSIYRLPSLPFPFPPQRAVPPYTSPRPRPRPTFHEVQYILTRAHLTSPTYLPTLDCLDQGFASIPQEDDTTTILSYPVSTTLHHRLKSSVCCARGINRRTSGRLRGVL